MPATVTHIARIARKNVRITFQQSQNFNDEYQNRLEQWTDYFSCNAYASTYAAHEGDSVVPIEERTITFETRWCPELKNVSSTGYRISFDGEYYDILSVDLMNYQHRTIRFTCTRCKRQ